MNSLFEGLQIGDLAMDGQVLLSTPKTVEFKAPNRKSKVEHRRDAFEITLTVVIHEKNCPEKSDVRWLSPQNRLRRLFVVAEFEPDTLKADAEVSS